MAIHYDRKSGRFRDAAGHWVSKERALKSSIAREELRKATQPRKRAPKPAPAPAPVKRKAAPPPSPPPKKPKPAPRRRVREDEDEEGEPDRGFVPPWERADAQDYPDDWFPEDYGYEDFIDDWGDYDDEETDS